MQKKGRQTKMQGKLKTFVLRRDRPETGAPGFESMGSAALHPAVAPQTLRIETLDAREGERAEIASERDTVGVGLSIPFAVIAPFATEADDGTGDNWGIGAIGADELDPQAGQGVKVAVLDTGISEAHPAFDGLDLVTENFTDDVPEDTDGHGTHCASTIFGQDVAGRRLGAARGVRRPLIGKVLGRGGGDSESILEGMLWARRNGARVISMSLGMDFTGYRQRLVAHGYHELEATSLALQGYRDNLRLFDRIAALFGDATVIDAPMLIAAAGNESRRPEYEIATAPPAAADGILSVGAIDENGNIATFSNSSPDCVGPGVGILGAALDGGLVRLSGTSMAAPHVAGIAVLQAAALAQRGFFTANELRTAVLARALTLPGLGRAEQGRGLVMV